MKIYRLLLGLVLLGGLAFGQTLTFPALSTNNTFTGQNTFSGATTASNLTFKGVPTVDVKAFGAQGDLQQEGGDNENTGHGTINSGTNTLADANATFTSNDCQTGTGCTGTHGNKLIVVYGAGAAWPSRQTSTLYATGALVYQKITVNGVPNIAVILYARIGGTTSSGALSVPTAWAGPPGIVLHTAGEVVDGGVTWDNIGGAPLAFANSLTSGLPLITTITGFTDSHHVTLALNAGTSVTTARVQWATDDTSAINSAISAACALTTGAHYGNYSVNFPYGGYGISSTISIPACLNETGPTLVAGFAEGSGQQEGSYLWNTSPNTDGFQYTSNQIGLVSFGVGVIGLGGGYGIGNGYTLGSPTNTTFEGGIYNAWVANNGGINVREENNNYFTLANNNLGGGTMGVFLNGGQAGNPSPCGQTYRAFIGANNKFFQAGGPDILLLNTRFNKVFGNNYGPALNFRLAATDIGAIQIEADASGSPSTSSCTYANTFEGTFQNNGNDYYITGPSTFHPSNNVINGMSSNVYQSVVKVANGDNNTIGPLTVFQSGGCFINSTNCTNVGPPVVDILGTSAGNSVNYIQNFFVSNPPFNPSSILHLGSTTTNTGYASISGSAATQAIVVDAGATVKAINQGLTSLTTDVAKASNTTETAFGIFSTDTTNPLQLRFQLIGNATVGSRGFYIQSTEPSVANQNLWLNPNGGNVAIGATAVPTHALDVTGSLGVSSTVVNVAGTATMGLTLKKGSGSGNYTNATTSYTVADSTNLCFTVTIPSGWKLGISASGALSTATAAVVAQAALTDNAACSTANAGILVETAPIQGAGIGIADAFSLDWVISGDGNAHNIALQFKTSNAADAASLINSSATITPTMKFELMPSN